VGETISRLRSNFNQKRILEKEKEYEYEQATFYGE
jgi:hypothetical protein